MIYVDKFANVRDSQRVYNSCSDVHLSILRSMMVCLKLQSIVMYTGLSLTLVVNPNKTSTVALVLIVNPNKNLNCSTCVVKAIAAFLIINVITDN